MKRLVGRRFTGLSDTIGSTVSAFCYLQPVLSKSITLRAIATPVKQPAGELWNGNGRCIDVKI